MNVLSGCVAITVIFTSGGNLEILALSAYFILLSAVFDFLDGFSARALKAYSHIGKELDSLADMVSFGIAPASIMYQLLVIALFGEKASPGFNDFSGMQLIPFAGFLIAVFSALRLAKFNIDTRQTESFIGLATPANAVLIASLPLVLSNHQDYLYFRSVILNPYFLIGATLFLSYMLNAELPMFSLKFKSLRWKDNRIRFVFIGISLLLIIMWLDVAIPFIILVYISLSIIDNVTRKRKQKIKTQNV